MKGTNTDPEVNDEETERPNIAGDVIGNTAYSERFVLKILLKFANCDTLKDEVNEKSFEEDLCTLWDMTAEKDVVRFLQKNDILNLLNFALPVVESPRITEILIGIIGNMCCQRDVVSHLLTMDSFLNTLIDYIKSDDSLILIQILRLVNSCLYVANEDSIGVWMDLFEKQSYHEALYYMLKNSMKKDLIVNALENFNTVCSYCNTDQFRSKFFKLFITKDALLALTTAFRELVATQNKNCEREEVERVLVISLQIMLTLVGFDKSLEIFSECKDSVSSMIEITMNYYENKLVNQKEMDTDLSDIVDSLNTICDVLELNQVCNVNTYFVPSYSIWKVLQVLKKTERNGHSNFEDDDIVELTKFTVDIESPLSSLICKYIGKCSEENLLKVLDVVGDSIETIISQVQSQDVKELVSKRTENHASRIKDNVDS